MTTTDISTEFEPWPHPSPMLDRLGPFWRHRHDRLRIGFRVEDHHLNARGFLHAGVIATIADVAIGHALAAATDPPTRLVTVNLSCDYVGTAEAGAWVDGRVTPTRLGRRLATGVATFSAGEHMIATARGLFLPADRPTPSA